MDRMRTARNIGIVVAIGLAFYFVPGGGRVGSAFVAFVWVMFGVAIAYLGLRFYRENQFRLSALGDHHRGLLYAAIALGFFCYMGRRRMWESGFGELAWFILAGLGIYAATEVYRRYRSYS